MSSPVLQLKDVSKTYKGRHGVAALSSIDISVNSGEFVCVIGANGCGKSTLLKIIAGISKASAGSVSAKETAYLPQQPSLLPWRTLGDNLLLPSDIKKKTDRRERARAAKLLKDFKLSEFAGFYPESLSGGMQQKAALLRTVLAKPKLMLLDEPFSSLDGITRVQMQQWLLELWQKTDTAAICVTHDVREAIFLADTIYVMTPRPGAILKKIAVDLPRPRRAAHLQTTAAKTLGKELDKLLEAKP